MRATILSSVAMFIVALGQLAPCAAQALAAADNLFARENLVAWCIVPFDAQKRGPAERAVFDVPSSAAARPSVSLGTSIPPHDCCDLVGLLGPLTAGLVLDALGFKRVSQNGSSFVCTFEK